MNASNRVVAVVVTHNRLGLLKGCLERVRGQSRKPEAVVVVDNGSTDGTAEWLAGQPDLAVLRQENQGSAGGQASGIKKACAMGADWIWCMDDDTRPERECLERMVEHPAAGREKTGFLCSLVVWKDGEAHRMNVPGIVPFLDFLGRPRFGDAVPVQTASFVSLLVHRRAVGRCGLPLREFFLWYDDLEYTQRIAGGGLEGWCVTASRAEHATPENRGSELLGSRVAYGPKVRHGLKNLAYMSTRDGKWIRRLSFLLEMSLNVALKTRLWSLGEKLDGLRSLSHGALFLRPEVETCPESAGWTGPAGMEGVEA